MLKPNSVEWVGLIATIRQKKELSSLAFAFIETELKNYLHNHEQIAVKLTANPKSALYKQVVKEVRERLRKVYGLFREKDESEQRTILLSKLLSKQKLDRQLLTAILTTHSSTQERLGFYEQLYQQLFTITGPPQSILDLGCGINPFSIPLMQLKSLHYRAYDLSEEELHALNAFFHYLHQLNQSFSGQAQVLNLLHQHKLPAADLCLLFKMTDVLDRGQGHKNTERILQAIPAKFVVVSFPTRTMSGKEMNVPRRPWFELLCNRLKYEIRILTFPNELFYVVKK